MKTKPQDFYIIRQDIRTKRKSKKEPTVCWELWIKYACKKTNK